MLQYKATRVPDLVNMMVVMAVLFCMSKSSLQRALVIHIDFCLLNGAFLK